jgi:short-subunit dehydrogenase
MKNFKNKVAIITGAASGLGRELAIVGAELGLKLVLADLQIDALQCLKTELEEKGVEVIVITCDVSKSGDVQALANAAINKFGKVHLLFNNAGVGIGGLIWENSLSDWEWVLGVNLWGVINGIQTFTPLMLEFAEQDESYEAHIINTASIAGLLNSPTMGVYNVSKHAVVSLSESLFHDLQLVKKTVSCSVLCPYFMPTNIDQAHLHRPENLKNKTTLTVSQQLSQTMTERATAAGSATPNQMAVKTFDAILDGSFYIYSDLNPLSEVQSRMEDILEARNPGDPYINMPQVRKFVEAKLRRVK